MDNQDIYYYEWYGAKSNNLYRIELYNLGYNFTEKNFIEMPEIVKVKNLEFEYDTIIERLHSAPQLEVDFYLNNLKTFQGFEDLEKLIKNNFDMPESELDVLNDLSNKFLANFMYNSLDFLSGVVCRL